MDRTLPSPKLLAVGGAVILASGAYAIGTQTGGGTADAAPASSSSAPTTYLASGSTGATAGRTRGPGRHGRDLDAAATALGVSAETLRTALEELRPERRDRDARRSEFAAALAKGLGVDAAKVTAALEAQKDAKRAGRRERPDRSAFFAALGKELGLSAAEVQTAVRTARRARGERRGGRDLAPALAKELGVSEAKLRAAFDAVGGPGRRGGPRFDIAAFAQAVGVSEAKLTSTLGALRADRRKEHEDERAAFTKALADKLGVSEAKVTEALGERGRFGGPGRGGPGHRGGHRGPGAPFGRRP